MNLSNFGVARGKVQNFKDFPNKDGSHKIFMTIGARNNYKNRDGKTTWQFVPVEAFVSAKQYQETGLGVYALIHEGDEISVGYTVKSGSFEKDSETVYTTSLSVTDVNLEDTRAEVAARLAAKEASAAQPVPAPEQ